MLRDLTPQAVFIGLLAAFVGFASSFAVVLAGLRAVGATEAEAASGLMASAIAMGLCGVVVSLRTKQPVSVAWTTPGAALLAGSASVAGGFSDAVGAFLICGGLIILSGLWRPFGRAVEAIPGSLANAMLAGILLVLCLAPFRAIAFDPLLGLPILVAWIIGGRINRFLGVPAALLAFILVVVFGVEFPPDWQAGIAASLLPAPEVIVPTFSLSALFGMALPLFIVTMASQNVPGLAVLKANGYVTKTGPLLTATGIFSFLSAPFAGISSNLAAITAAMLAGEEAGPDSDKRYWGTVVCGVAYCLFGLFAGVVIAFVSLAPSILIEAVAGLALISAFGAASLNAFKVEEERPAAAVTFLAAASGMTILGISGAFWGLIAGGIILALAKRKSA
ncbi:benzoate/H(+) symporter BenE family transporter [Ahrensia marina]|uniref:benzoate/H(+) symporter BenE family transporter n=1 Tax=Ahrensia marina TaxID=1514904 RepID=UPI0035D0C3FF